MKILGWYSLIWLAFSTLVTIGNSKMDGTTRVISILTVVPILFYIALNLF